MKKNLRTRGIVIGVLTLLCAVIMLGPWHKPKDYTRTASDFFNPKRWKQNMSENIRLGLDLKGGTHLVMQVQADEYLKTYTENERQKIDEFLKKENIPFNAVKTNGAGKIIVETADTSKHGDITNKVTSQILGPDWPSSTSGSPATVTFTLNNSAANFLKNQATEQALTIIEQRLNAFGVAEPTIQRQGRDEDHQILVQMPGVDNPERVKELLKVTSKLELKAVVPGTQFYPTKEAAEAAVIDKNNQEALKVTEGRSSVAAGASAAREGYQIVEKIPIVSGSDLRNANARPNAQGMGGYEITFELKPNAADRFEQWTSKNIGNYLAIVLNGEIKSAPVIKGAIRDTGSIEGSFTKEQAEDLALTLRSGALPADIVYLQESTVGPSLGADSIRSGIIASVVGLGLVILFMLFYYKFSGVNAVIALFLNLLILLAGLALFNATLTLPGIAGVILLIGMAVDSNVLIFERIREELRAGKLVASAVDIGFNKALTTIIDTHVTTIVSCAFLYAFGTGPIRGFAVTLVIGLLANLFTAVYVSRTMYMWVLSRQGGRAETISI
ncbi:MAG TPA: protein translocase subunit SecD [Blastocatellia bacterium]|nr:protein translocase subunit SecD [Blastocatellia bacterium]